MDTSNPKPEIKGAISALLEEANTIYQRVYTSALTFLALGLLVAAGGVLYFYFSSDALFLDRAFYEEQIAKLEADKTNLLRGTQVLADDYHEREEADTIRKNTLNNYIDLNIKLLASYRNFYLQVLDTEGLNTPKEKVAYIRSILPAKDSVFRANLKTTDSLQADVKKINTHNAKRDTIISKLGEITKSPALPLVRDNDKAELTFTPKLVYGFLSRLGGLIFIELVAFYLLRQYRINMNDFRYYYGIARQARVNLYLIDSVEKIEDEKSRIDIVSKLFNPSLEKVELTDEPPLAASDIDAARKLLDSIKDLIKK